MQQQQASSGQKSSAGALYFFLSVMGIGGLLLVYAVFFK